MTVDQETFIIYSGNTLITTCFAHQDKSILLQLHTKVISQSISHNFCAAVSANQHQFQTPSFRISKFSITTIGSSAARVAIESKNNLI
jgi:hypothetical protein